MFMKNKQWRAASLQYAPIHQYMRWGGVESFAKGLHTHIHEHRIRIIKIHT